jgi:hypothetical protein
MGGDCRFMIGLDGHEVTSWAYVKSRVAIRNLIMTLQDSLTRAASKRLSAFLRCITRVASRMLRRLASPSELTLLGTS